MSPGIRPWSSVSFVILRHKLRTRQRDRRSQSLDKRSAENGYTITPLSVLAYLYTLYPPIQLPTHRNYSLANIPLVKMCGKRSVASSHLLFSLTPPLSIGGSNSGLQSGAPHCLVDPILLFLVDRFHSVPVPVCVLPQQLFLKALEAPTLPLH
ncbi:unnamed protein product [Protopolystoma xenopodis]|uniref:Uncharacterized protein n=1 Tax=Protopolystoma xenopodis TaxID=117903 RepID=A0A3S5APL7_9PLAT|nr:unnamed protein product [Protopolystoma xenopodis]